MKIVFSKIKVSDTLYFETREEHICVSVPNNCGPELSLDDGSIIIFKNDRQHFRVMTDPEIFDGENINKEALQRKYLKCVDRCYNQYGNRYVFTVESYEILGEQVYRFL